MFPDLIVVELASVLAGPSVAMFFAELGAKVIKIENPKTGGDVTRRWKLPSENPDTDISAYFACANWGKYSVGLDISSATGLGVLKKLLSKADIVITSYKAGDASKLNVSYEAIKAINPAIIYASLSGYGEDDPRTAYDAVLQAETGFMSMNGTSQTGPLKMPVALIDILAAHQLKEAILLALMKRMNTGEGDEIKVSLYGSAISSLANQASNYLFSGEAPQASGSEHPNIAPYGETFHTHDGKHIILAVGSDKQFLALAEILNITDVRNFATNSLRLKNREVLKLMLAEKIKNWPSEKLSEQMRIRNIPGGIVKNVGEALESPESANQFIGNNGLKGISQIAFETNRAGLINAPVSFGTDTFTILKEYTDITDLELIDLQDAKIIFGKKML